MLSRLVCIAILAGCAGPGQNNVAVPSTIIQTQSADQVRESLVGVCAGAGMVVQSTSPGHVTCSKPLDQQAQGFLYKALLTERHASTPEIFSHFIIYQSSSGVGVSVREWIEHQNAYGKTTKNYLTHQKSLRAMQDALDNLKRSADGCWKSECRDALDNLSK